MLKVMKVLTQKKYQDHIPCIFAYNLVCVDDDRSLKPIFLEVKMLLKNLKNQFLKSLNTVKKVMKNIWTKIYTWEKKKQKNNSNQVKVAGFVKN